MLRHTPTTRWEACRSGLRIAFRHEAAGPASSAAFAHVGGDKTRRKAGGLWARLRCRPKPSSPARSAKVRAFAKSHHGACWAQRCPPPS
jgi:hypothetical protein